MTDPFVNSTFDMPLEPNATAERYEKLHEAGKSTRFVKGKSGNPAGRRKGQRTAASYREALKAFRITRARLKPR
jgi:hypothetical protein